MIKTGSIKTKEQIAADNASANERAIKAKADEIILSKYDETKQRKMQSQGLKLTLKQAKGETLTTNEQTLEDSLLAIDDWITAIRTIENTAITDGTLLDDIDWTVV